MPEGVRFDADFYGAWNEDLRGRPAKDLLKHWQKHGVKEGRPPNFNALLEDLGLQIDALPPDFDWRVYVAANAHVDGVHASNAYRAKVHFLSDKQPEQLVWCVDLHFYGEMYPEAARCKTVAAATDHWLREGRANGLHPTLSSWLRANGYPGSLLPKGPFLSDFKAANQSDADESIEEALRKCLNLSVIRPLDQDAQQNLDLFWLVGAHHEKAGRDDLAEKAYLYALSFGSTPKIYEHLGNCALRKGNAMKAACYYQQAINHDSRSMWAYRNFVETQLTLGEAGRAVEVASDVWSSHPDIGIPDALLQRAVSMLWSKEQPKIEFLAETQDRAALVHRVQEAAQVVYEGWEAYTLRGSAAPAVASLNRQKVLIVGDFFIPQCVRYRIDQKLEQLELAGYEAQAVPWTEAERARTALQLCDQVIFYRVPALPEVIRLMAQARTLGKLVFYEIDDLLFDPMYPPPLHTYGGYVGMEQYRDLTRGMALFRAAAQLCDHGIASTEPLARRLGQLVRTGQCYVHRNGLDRHNIFTAGPSAADKGHLNIFYGSGTQAHNSDFTDLALPALERILAEHPQVRLTVVGYLKLPQAFTERFEDQVVQVPLVSNIKAYWQYLQASDINLAVLHRDAINDCKSELKWFEAACFGIPSVLSRTQNYEDVIRDGEDGLLVQTPQEWYEALKRLVQEPPLRQRIGASAQVRVRREYTTQIRSHEVRNYLGDASRME